MENTEKTTTAAENVQTAPITAARGSKAANRRYIGTLTGLGILTALVVVLQLFSSVIKFGTVSITLTLTPIIVGGALYGALGGAWLGAVFGVVVLLQPDTLAFFFPVNPAATIVLCLLKGIAAGVLGALVFRLLEKKNLPVAVVAAGIAAPTANTGIFILGTILFFMDVYGSIENLLIGVITLNFFIEVAVNLALSVVTVTIIRYVKKIERENAQ